MSNIIDSDSDSVSTLVQDLISVGILEKNTTTNLSNGDVRRSYIVKDKFMVTISSSYYDAPVRISQISETFIKKLCTLNRNIMLFETGAWCHDIKFNEKDIIIFKAYNSEADKKEKDIINWDMVRQTEPIKDLVKNNIFSLNEVSRNVYKNLKYSTSISYIVSDNNIEVIYRSKVSSGSFRVGFIVEHYNLLGVFTNYEIVEFNNVNNHKYDNDLRFIHVYKEIVI